jgi:hypothetical protein
MHTSLGYLKLKLPGGGEQEFEISKPEITVGRGQTNDIVIQDAKMSRAHARFEFNDRGEVTVLDAGSTNGVRVNGNKVEKAVIQPGDVVQMGESQIQYKKASDEDEGMTIINSEFDLDRTIADFVLPTVLNDLGGGAGQQGGCADHRPQSDQQYCDRASERVAVACADRARPPHV